MAGGAKKASVVVEPCRPPLSDGEVAARVGEVLARLPGLAERLARAERIFIKVNLGSGPPPRHMGRATDYVDPAVFRGLAIYLRRHSGAEVLVGDAPGGPAPERTARERGHLTVMDEAGFQFVNLHRPPYARYDVPRPVMFRYYELAQTLREVDLFISLQKIKAHHLCGLSLSIKNLFGLPPGPVYGEPRAALHSPVRLPRILADLAQLFPPSLSLLDGIVGCNKAEWVNMGGEPLVTGLLIAGDNAVATDAVAARCMGVDPLSSWGRPPFVRTESHVALAAELGLGPASLEKIQLMGEIPQARTPYNVLDATDPQLHARMRRQREALCRMARHYFGQRERYVQRYSGQIIALARDRLLFHAPPDQLDAHPLFETCSVDGIPLYETFVKLVRPEEDELQEPYSLN
jgi:uncharacterized protein (DUF362 family)